MHIDNFFKQWIISMRQYSKGCHTVQIMIKVIKGHAFYFPEYSHLKLTFPVFVIVLSRDQEKISLEDSVLWGLQKNSINKYYHKLNISKQTQNFYRPSPKILKKQILHECMPWIYLFSKTPISTKHCFSLLINKYMQQKLLVCLCGCVIKIKMFCRISHS